MLRIYWGGCLEVSLSILGAHFTYLPAHLRHPERLDDLDDADDEEKGGPAKQPPPVPKVPDRFAGPNR